MVQKGTDIHTMCQEEETVAYSELKNIHFSVHTGCSWLGHFGNVSEHTTEQMHFMMSEI